MERRKAGEGRYEEARRRLIERGYLSGQVERFVLLPSLRSRTFGGALVRSAAQSALLAGPILGALLAVALGWTQRPLVRPLDLPLLWAYFTIPSAIALFVLELATGWGTSAVRSLRVGRWLSVPVLVYALALWWSAPRPRTALEDLAFLALALPAVAAIGWLSGLVSVAAIVGRTGDAPERPRRRWGRTAALACTLVVAVVAVRALLADRGAPQGVPDFAVAAGGARLVVIGIDGLDGDLLARLDERHAVPSLMAAIERGSAFALTRAERAEPAAVWTTILTGLPPERHGITGAGTDWLAGVSTPVSRPVPLWATLRWLLPSRRAPTSGAQRRARTLWEIVALRERAVAVGWWATWPAPQADGASVVVSDRVLPKLLAGAEPDRDTSPEVLFDRLRSRFGEARDALRSEFDRRFAGAGEGPLDRWLWDSYLIDGFSARVFSELMANPDVRAGFLYLPGLDILRSRLEGADVETAAMFETVGALERYGAFLDRIVATWTDEAESGRVVLLGDPGRSAAADAEGFLAVSGKPAATTCVGPALGPLAVAPTILGILGYPRSLEMPGTPPAGCFPEGFGAKPAISSYGRVALDRESTRSDFDPEMLERLRSLGYLR